MKLWRRLRARLARRLVHEAYWRGYEEGAVDYASRLVARIGVDA